MEGQAIEKPEKGNLKDAQRTERREIWGRDRDNRGVEYEERNRQNGVRQDLCVL